VQQFLRFPLQRLCTSRHFSSQVAQASLLRCRKRALMVRIMIADDSPPVRRGLRTLLGLNSDWQVCGEAVDGADAVEKAQQLAPDLILMDFSMPQMDGVQAARKIVASGTDIPILLFTLNLSPQLMELARNAGLRGAMSKSEISKLPYAIKALQRGETFFYAT
jgi:DNA-binding NarL/FixJ family response regulator